MNDKIPLPGGMTAGDIRRTALRAHRSKQSYYNEEYSEQARKILDTLHSQGQDILVPAGDMPLSTLRLKYYNGVHYLLEQDDENGHYKDLYDRTTCRTTSKGLHFSVRKVARSKTALAEFIIMSPTWRDELQEFLITAQPNSTFEKEDLRLSESDLTWINDQLAGLVKKVEGEDVPLFFGEITQNKILLVRDND